MIKHNKPGYILVLTLMILAIAIIITTQLFNQGTVHSIFANTIVEREKAKQLALGGIQVAMSLLTPKEPAEQKKTDEAAQAEPKDEKRAQLKKLLPVLNRWLTFDLKEELDGIDGQLKICLSCEQGKLDLNTVYDFKKKKFVGQDQLKGDMKKFMEIVFKNMKEWTGEKDLFGTFETYLKERGRPFNDVTELLSIKEFAVFKDAIFYNPPSKNEKQKPYEKKRPIYLTDIFTIDSGSLQFQPWVFSDSWCAILNLRRAADGEIKKRTEEVSGWLKNFKPQSTWSSDWDKMLKPVYNKDFTSLPKDIDSVLATQFESHTFSVLTYGKVGEIEQRLYAIIERNAAPQKEDNAHFVVKKIYWI